MSSEVEFVSGYDKSGYINGYPVRSKYLDKDFFKLTLSKYNFNLNGSSGSTVNLHNLSGYPLMLADIENIYFKKC